ncbi:phospholipase/Carboxylesterase family protein [Orientia chuto str. Dubai]|uniref:Phospholipase/Carboxylesterase family protein n=1 Tax=Orientia chuto str. Dubai TaxID=1359168 RepID=A0A0F3MKV0_9RICK|nr:dienelactone hydrolase family protein [Candidatus Orientia mediorientalis]KJV56375.1 phospholipase/Carboxylesterase family protein [Orientia chuto str. Dubai]
MHQLEITSKESETKQLIVLLHGVGSNGHDLISIAPFMQQSFPAAHFFAPNGIEPYDGGLYGYQWFSLKQRDPAILKIELERTTPLIIDLINQKQKQLGLANQDTILIGFSQGVMASIYLTLSAEIPFKATVGFSGAMISPNSVTCIKTPICLIHGKEDTVVPYDISLNMYQILQSYQVKVEHYVIDNLTHSIDINGINIANNFIRQMIFD